MATLREMRDRGGTLWITGLSGAGKTTTARALRDELHRRDCAAIVIDGDELRATLSTDLGFSAADRDENVRRAGAVAELLAKQGVVAVVALISPRAAARRAVRDRHRAAGLAFVEVYLNTPIDVCERRDPKALYQRARAGEGLRLSGVDDPYEPPADPDVTVSAEVSAPEELAAAVLASLPEDWPLGA